MKTLNFKNKFKDVLKIIIVFFQTPIPVLNILIQITAIFLTFWWISQFLRIPENFDIDIIILSIGILCNIGPFLSVTKFGKKFRWLLLIFFIPSFLMSLLLFFRYPWILTVIYSIFIIAIMQMFRRNTIAITLSIFIIVTLIIQSYLFFSMTPQERYFYHALKYELNHGHKIIPLKKLTNFYWDKIFFCGPYSLRSEMKDIDIEGKNYLLDKSIDLSFGGEWALIFVDHKSKNIISIIGKDNYMHDTIIEGHLFLNTVHFMILKDENIQDFKYPLKLLGFNRTINKFILSY